jgi:hypothetical protein
LTGKASSAPIIPTASTGAAWFPIADIISAPVKPFAGLHTGLIGIVKAVSTAARTNSDGPSFVGIHFLLNARSATVGLDYCTL